MHENSIFFKMIRESFNKILNKWEVDIFDKKLRERKEISLKKIYYYPLKKILEGFTRKKNKNCKYKSRKKWKVLVWKTGEEMTGEENDKVGQQCNKEKE